MLTDSTSKLHALNLQNPLDIEWPCYEDFFPFEKNLEVPPLDSFFDFNSFPFPFHCDHLSQFEFQNQGNFGFEIFSVDKQMPPLFDDMVVDEKPQNILLNTFQEDKQCGGIISVKSEVQEVTDMIEREIKPSLCQPSWDVPMHPVIPVTDNIQIEREFSSWNEEGEEKKRLNNGRRKSVELELDEIKRYFNVPISEAAKEMKVGLTVLKKRCRELNIMRWPHRKLKSLKSLINNVKEMGLTNEIMMLEEHKRLLEKLPDMDLTERTKRLRQACFKANYKKRRSMTMSAFH